MKTVLLLAVLMNSGLAFGFSEPGGVAGTQPAAGASAAVPGEEQSILVEAWRRDRALDAFLRGDFATAEIEFKKNLRCIRRIELQLEYSFKQGQIEMYRAASLMNGPNIHNLPARPEQIRERTCHSKQWQLYMIGLSQIQLGRFDEAKKSLRTAAHMSKEELLFDAHYRVGLLELLDGNVDSANRRLAHLVHMKRSCLARTRTCEVGVDLDAATAYLARAVADARQGISRY
ncbi:MAG TPA: hypothetical protein VF033_13605 [Steroidobacteraceae bacterium]